MRVISVKLAGRNAAYYIYGRIERILRKQRNPSNETNTIYDGKLLPETFQNFWLVFIVIERYVQKYSKIFFVTGPIRNPNLKTMKKNLLFAALILCAGYASIAQTVTKQLYLSSPGQVLDRVDPVATGDLSTSQSNTLYGAGGFETITQVGAPASSNASQYATTHSFSYNSGATGTSRILLVGVSYLNSNNRSVSSVSYGGQTMTLVGDLNYNNGSGTYYTRVYIYRLIAPATGSNTLSVTWSGALSQGAVVGAITYTGVNQSTPTGTFASASGYNTTPAVTVAGATGRLMFGVISGQTTSA